MKFKAAISLAILLLQKEVSCFLQPLHSLPVTSQLMSKAHHDVLSLGAQLNSPSAKAGRKALTVNGMNHRRPTVSPIHASETSFHFADLLTSRQESWHVRFHGLRVTYPTLQVLYRQAVSGQTATLKFLRETWWLCPMFLALVPIYSAVFHGQCACMPEWWQVVKMDTIRQSKDAALIIGGFLVSNVAYFASGAFLLTRFPVRSVKKRHSIVPLVKPTSFSMLGIWILLAGTVSTIFHSVQALGSHAISESLCYVDHAVAISAAFYFVKQCGLPSRKVWAIGIASLVTLVYCHPAYAAIHSLWHFLSATTATQWALEGYQRALERKSAASAEQS